MKIIVRSPDIIENGIFIVRVCCVTSYFVFLLGELLRGVCDFPCNLLTAFSPFCEMNLSIDARSENEYRCMT